MGSICTLAFFGTIVAMGCIAVVMWVVGLLGLSPDLSIFYTSLYGALLHHKVLDLLHHNPAYTRRAE